MANVAYLKIGMVVDREGPDPPDPVTVVATVDSGAVKSVFPLQIARDLGIQDDELVQDEHEGQGVGSRFPVWHATVPIRAGIGLFELDEHGEDVGWGPEFTLNPGFIEHETFLLGNS